MINNFEQIVVKNTKYPRVSYKYNNKKRIHISFAHLLQNWQV